MTTVTPLLRPGLDPSHTGKCNRAWAFLWAATATGPVAWAPARDELIALFDLSPKTADNLIRTAITQGHLTKRGGYSQKRQTDTRTIQRRSHT